MQFWMALAVFCGAGVGALARWAATLRFNPVWEPLPLGTLLVNLAGGYLVGVAVVVFGHHADWPAEWRLAAITGFLGGLTTFSTFSSEVVGQLLRGEAGLALLTAGLHLAGSLLLTWLGILTARAFI
ncbi:fluoride efflux transporter CrcB [Crenobacter cavernae]|uniref:Fluoride-specific ion channel FluC n=1 Tax=Crenobacter cavernae TaxID=2290923 RepID=A0ABY0F9F7_9NEIS|nr:fluoride efflux transporter CrcB [Crenobacter cavernae]RXZ42038.1 fluoride efflux transporter CrcB [Crenobacter cavernae]